MRADIIRRRGYPATIAGDELALSMASYPQTAQYLARRLEGVGEIICELCCGIGISLIELSKSFRHVVGIDNNSAVLADCKQNLENAGVKNFTLILADINDPEIFNDIQADVIIYGIPYWDTYSAIAPMVAENPSTSLVISNIRRKITNNVVISAPPTATYTQAFGILGHCEFNEVYLDGKHDRNYIFLGDLMAVSARTREELSTSPYLSTSESSASEDHTEHIGPLASQ